MDTKTLAKQILKSQVLRKSAKGYSLAYLYIILPRLLSIASRSIKKKEDAKTVYKKVINALKRAFLPNRFPAFVAKLITGVYLLNKVTKSTFLSSIISGLITFNQYKSALKTHPNGTDTSDLTLFILVRACDLLTRNAYRRYKVSKRVQELGDVGLFTISCFAIMFAWFFYPERLPPSYRKWITAAANMDNELVDALRYLRQGKIIYGVKTEHDDILHNMCAKNNLDPKFGKFSESIPLPCEVVHSNIKGCEIHAAWRWYRGFISGLSVYLPLNVLVAIVSKSWKTAWKHVLVSSARSSAFLATFITLCWYGVCLVRTRLGPLFFPNATAQQLEDTYGPGLGSALCGLSSLIEYPKRRGELALFVTPRALSIAFPSPSEQSVKHKTLESILFSVSFAILASGNKQNVRGVFNKLLTAVF